MVVSRGDFTGISTAYHRDIYKSIHRRFQKSCSVFSTFISKPINCRLHTSTFGPLNYSGAMIILGKRYDSARFRGNFHWHVQEPIQIAASLILIDNPTELALVFFHSWKITGTRHIIPTTEWKPAEPSCYLIAKPAFHQTADNRISSATSNSNGHDLQNR